MCAKGWLVGVVAAESATLDGDTWWRLLGAGQDRWDGPSLGGGVRDDKTWTGGRRHGSWPHGLLRPVWYVPSARKVPWRR